MAVSMKDLDPTFQGVGNKAGLEIWRIENSRPIAIPRSQYGTFYCGESYLILLVTALKSGGFRYDIHYWLGRSMSENEADAAAFKAMELDAALGGRAVQYREVEGYETDKFLSYFKPCFIPIEGNASSGFKKADNLYKERLFLCKGRHIVRIKEVPFVRSSLNHENIFVLDTESKIFQFNGAQSSIHERVKALDVVEYIKKTYHKNSCEVAIIEDGKFVADADSGEFWSHFGGFAPLGKKVGEEDRHKNIQATSVKLFSILEGEAKEIRGSTLKREMLETNNCYLLDRGSELFIWVGRNTTLDIRLAANLVSKEFLAKQGRSQSPHITCVIEGFEPREFKVNFEVWPQVINIPVSEDGRGKVAALLKQQGFNVKGLLKAGQPKEAFQSLLSGAGRIQVWRVNLGSKNLLSPDEQGKFYSNDCYVIMYTYPGDQKEEYMLCSWLGHESTKETEAVAGELAAELAGALKDRAVQVRIFERKEPTQFLALFERMCIMKDGEALEEGTALFQIYKLIPHNCQAIQVQPVATSLNSSSCFILQMDSKVFTWYGKFSTLEEQESTEDMVKFLQPGRPSSALKEGTEPEPFWKALGGKKVYSSHRDAKEPAKDPRLFVCSHAKGPLEITEVFDFAQHDLLSDEILLLDCFTEVFVWVGQQTTAAYKQKAFEIGQKYLEQASAYEGSSSETPIYKITEGNEPAFFTAFFSWDPSKSPAVSDPFKRKLSEITGQSPKVLHSRNRSPANLPRSSPSRYSIPTAERTFQTRTSPIKQETPPRSTSKSSAIARLSSIFEVPKDEDATPRTPFPKLSALCLATEEVKRKPLSLRTLSTCPSPRAGPSPRSPAIAALSTMFESFMVNRGAFDTFADDKRRWTDENAAAVSPTKQSEGRETPAAKEVTYELPVAVAGSAVNEGREMEGSEETARWFPYERLRVSSKDPVAGIDHARRESYLTDEEFKAKFHMEKEAFYKLPKWKQGRYKLLLDLF